MIWTAGMSGLRAKHSTRPSLHVRCLCLYRFLWGMNEKGNPNSWTELFSIDHLNIQRFIRRFSYNPDCIQSLYCIDNKAAVMFDVCEGEFIYYGHLGGPRYKQLKFRGRNSDFQAIAYTTSFIFLKDIVGPDNAQILNINSRYGTFFGSFTFFLLYGLQMLHML